MIILTTVSYFELWRCDIVASDIYFSSTKGMLGYLIPVLKLLYLLFFDLRT